MWYMLWHTSAIQRKSPIRGESPIGFSHTRAIQRKITNMRRTSYRLQSYISHTEENHHTRRISYRLQSYLSHTEEKPVRGESPYASVIPQSYREYPRRSSYRLQNGWISGIAKSFRGKKGRPAIPEPYVRMPEL
jgi:hypothetical protein